MPLVLIVEDEPIIRMSAADLLEDDGFEVIEATTARAALAILEKRHGDVAALFTDVDMPGDMNGLELAGVVYSRWPHIAILVTSGVVRVTGSLPGGGVFLAKPYADAAPVQIIRGLIERLEASRRPAGRLGGDVKGTPMAPNITCQTILVPTNRSGAIEQGILVFADDTLVAVLKRLEKCTGDDVTDLCGRWFVESGYGPCTVAPGTEHLLLSLAEVQQWVLEKVTRAYENEGPQFV